MPACCFVRVRDRHALPFAQASSSTGPAPKKVKKEKEEYPLFSRGDKVIAKYGFGKAGADYYAGTITGVRLPVKVNVSHKQKFWYDVHFDDNDRGTFPEHLVDTKPEGWVDPK